MSEDQTHAIVKGIGKEVFDWLSVKLDRKTRIKDIPDEILHRIGNADITVRDYGKDENCITAIAFLTFVYGMAGIRPQAINGPNDILLLKVLCRMEVQRRTGTPVSAGNTWDLPVWELVTGEVGERIRRSRFMTTPP
ncbi:MAG: hypothetical protein JW821_17365 [Deltaproteobacteria bacterium]|nr:hypothetical protein [Deltaproteobacteria bacterium]